MVGCFADRICLPAKGLKHIPEAVTYADAAAFGVVYGTAYHTLRSVAEVGPGDKVLVLGAAGGVGLAAVELAQLEYSLPRLKRLWTHLSRMKMGVGMRGPGEKQLEVDRRLVEKRIHDLRSELHVIERRKERQVAARGDHMTVSLVGYTNVGKSTIMTLA